MYAAQTIFRSLFWHLAHPEPPCVSAAHSKRALVGPELHWLLVLVMKTTAVIA